MSGGSGRAGGRRLRGRPHRTRWKVSQYMSRGCAAATAMVRYMRSWFRAPRTGTPSAAASARIFSRSVRIWEGRGDGRWVYPRHQPAGGGRTGWWEDWADF